MGEEDLADPVLLNLDHIDLARFEVVGNYVRFDEKTRHALKDFRRKVMAGLDGPLGSKENYLIWGPPGSGKTFLVQELARSYGRAGLRRAKPRRIQRRQVPRLVGHPRIHSTTHLVPR